MIDPARIGDADIILAKCEEMLDKFIDSIHSEFHGVPYREDCSGCKESLTLLGAIRALRGVR